MSSRADEKRPRICHSANDIHACARVASIVEVPPTNNCDALALGNPSGPGAGTWRAPTQSVLSTSTTTDCQRCISRRPIGGMLLSRADRHYGAARRHSSPMSSGYWRRCFVPAMSSGIPRHPSACARPSRHQSVARLQIATFHPLRSLRRNQHPTVAQVILQLSSGIPISLE